MSTTAAHHEEGKWAKRALVIIVAVIALIGLGLLGAAFLPRWWSHRVADQANGSFTGGILLGIFYGFVFTVLPLAMLRFTFHKRRTWKTWGWMFGVAVLLATPNLLTLGIVLGSGHGAHAGDRTLDVDAPGFRGASLGGAIAAVVAFLLWEYLRYTRRHARDEVRRLKAELKAAKEPPPPPPPAPSSEPPRQS
jgi:MFS family permease